MFNHVLVRFSQTVWCWFTQKVCQLRDTSSQTTSQDLKRSASSEEGFLGKLLNTLISGLQFSDEMRVIPGPKFHTVCLLTGHSLPPLPSLSPPSINVMSKSWPLGRDVEREIGPIMCHGV